MSTRTKTLTPEATFALLDRLRTHHRTTLSEAKACRNHCMALLMLDAGLRVGELVQLKVADIWFMNNPVNNLLVSAEIAKRHKERTIPLSDRIRHAINMMNFHGLFYDECSPPNFAFHGSNFLSHLTTRQVERIIRAASLQSLGRPIHPHILRHTFASRLMKRTNIRVVQELLGHSSIASTQIYTHPDEEDKTTAIQNLLFEIDENGNLTDRPINANGPTNRIDTPGTNGQVS